MVCEHKGPQSAHLDQDAFGAAHALQAEPGVKGEAGAVIPKAGVRMGIVIGILPLKAVAVAEYVKGGDKHDVKIVFQQLPRVV